MTRVCLLVPTLQTGDAIGHDVAGMFAWLRTRGVETHILAQYWKPDVTLPIEPLARYAAYAARRDTITIYHHSTFWSEAGAPFLEAAGPKILRYHGVTPPAFFAPYCDELTHTTGQGRLQTQAFARAQRIDLFLNDSQHNARELQALGAPADRCAVSPPFHALNALDDLPADVPFLERHIDATYNVLFVGRVVPNKGHRHLLGAVSAYRRLFGTPVRLLVVGELDPRLRTYHAELAALARGLRVEDTEWVGWVDAARLKASYLMAHVFLVMSEHEGFCVPVVEAMAFGIPVVAHASTAVGETVGDAGVVLPGLDYDHYAAALDIVLRRADVRDALRARQRRRVADSFSATAVSARFASALAPWLGEVRDATPPGAPPCE